MLSEALGLKLENLSTLQRKLLVELLQRRYPRYWGEFSSPECSWRSRKGSLEEFIQNHSSELFKEFAKAGLHGNCWKTAGRKGKYVQG